MSENGKLSAAKFGELAEVSRQIVTRLANNGTLVKENKKLDIYHPANRIYLESRELKLNKKIIETFEENNPVEIKTEIKTIKKEKTVSPVKTVKAKPRQKKIINLDPESSDEPKKETLQEQKLRLEVEKLTEQRDKLKRENEAGRAELVEKETFVETVFSHFSSLHKNIMEMPAGFLDDLKAGIQSGLTRSEQLNIITIPICEAIVDSKKEIKKEINRMIREARL